MALGNLWESGKLSGEENSAVRNTGIISFLILRIMLSSSQVSFKRRKRVRGTKQKNRQWSRFFNIEGIKLSLQVGIFQSMWQAFCLHVIRYVCICFWETATVCKLFSIIFKKPPTLNSKVRYLNFYSDTCVNHHTLRGALTFNNLASSNLATLVLSNINK